MRPISDKKCPICHATFPSKVVFCSVCGTELEEELTETKPSFDFPISDSSKNTIERRFFRDEPLETRNRDTEYIVDDTQFAWQFSDTVVPLKMKGDISYSDNFKSPKLRIKQVKELSIYQLLVLGSLGLAISFSFIVFASISFLLSLGLVQASGLSISLVILSFGVFSALYYVINFLTTKIIANWKDKQVKVTKASIISYSIAHLIHIAVIALISIALIQILIHSSESANSGYTIYLPAFLIAILISIISPPFRIVKILSTAGSDNIFQNFQDAIQFPRISIRRSIEVSLVSYLLPAFLLISVLSSLSKIFIVFLSPESTLVISTWDYIGFIIMILTVMVGIVITTFVDVNTFYYYEELIQQYVEPPSLKWMKNQYDDDEDESGTRTIGGVSRENRCPVCSSLLIEGAEFCTDCGKKVVK